MFVDDSCYEPMVVDERQARALARWAVSKFRVRVDACAPGDDVVDERGYDWVCVGKLLFQRVVLGVPLLGSVAPFSPRRWVIRYPAASMYG